MKCPYCGHLDNKVIDSRLNKESTITRRRRSCLSCNQRFTTYERLEVMMPVLVKKDGRREVWDRQKMVIGLEKACEKRPVSRDNIDKFVDEIERKLQDLGAKEVSSKVIGQWVMEDLPKLDEVAYVRFASVYRQFKDVNEFMDELKTLLDARAMSDFQSVKDGGKVTAEKDRYYMRMALKEARKGLGKTSPNPCVGAVIVKDDRVVAKGYHEKAGKPHAEINALRKAGKEADGATIYVTLEPCNHTGRTPPCSQALVAAGIKRVVVGMEDPNPLVHGSGLTFLIDQKIAVLSGVLAEECREINRPFLKFITTSMPWVVMKAGISLDGRITYRKGKSGWITGHESLRKVHQLRDCSDAIMVGIGTISIDDPSLTTRLTNRKGKDPVRVILDSGLRIPVSAKVLHLHSNAATWIFCGPEADPAKKEELTAIGAIVRSVGRDETGGVDVREVLAVLGREGITSVLVEGGAKIHGSMLRNCLVDHVNLFYAPLFAGDSGIPVVQGLSVAGSNEAIRLKKIRYKRFGDDLMVEGDVSYQT